MKRHIMSLILFIFGLSQFLVLNDSLCAEDQRSLDYDKNKLAIFMGPDTQVERVGNEIKGVYVQGMPIILMVRLVNVDMKYDKQNAKPITVEKDWQKHIRFDVSNEDKQVELQFEYVVDSDQASARITNIAGKADLIGRWFIDGSNTAKMNPGIWRIICKYHNIMTEKVLAIRIVEPSNEQDQVDTTLRRARLYHIKGQYAESLSLCEELASQREKLNFRDTISFLFLQSDLYRRQHKNNKALTSLEELQKIDAQQNLGLASQIEFKINEIVRGETNTFSKAVW